MKFGKLFVCSLAFASSFTFALVGCKRVFVEPLDEAKAVNNTQFAPGFDPAEFDKAELEEGMAIRDVISQLGPPLFAARPEEGERVGVDELELNSGKVDLYYSEQIDPLLDYYLACISFSDGKLVNHTNQFVEE